MSNGPTTNWAKRTKQLTTEVDDLLPVTLGKGGGEDFEEIIAYYQYSAGKNPTPKTRVLAVNDEITGIYEGFFVAGKFNKNIYKIKTEEGLVAVTTAGQLDKFMAKVAPGAKVKIIYRGKSEMKTGQNAGTLAHTFIVRASKLVE